MSKNENSILTTAMLNADASEETEVLDNEKFPTFDPASLKKLARKVAIGALIATNVYFVAKAIRSASDEDETTSSED